MRRSVVAHASRCASGHAQEALQGVNAVRATHVAKGCARRAVGAPWSRARCVCVDAVGSPRRALTPMRLEAQAS
jgi:hypothetical protein